jgi:hypothetical protein
MDQEATVQSLTFSGGTLQGSNGITVTQVMTWTGGTQSGSGATTIAPGATLNVNGSHVTQDPRTLNNAGTVNWTATIYWFLNNGAVLNNLAGATFNAQTNGGILGSSGVFNNQGTFICSGPGVSSVALPFNNTGTVNVESGVLQFSNSFVQNAGATWLSGGSLTKSGALVFNGGTLGGTGIITGNVANLGGDHYRQNTPYPGQRAQQLVFCGRRKYRFDAPIQFGDPLLHAVQLLQHDRGRLGGVGRELGHESR